ncbi:hypothetical protein [Shewanella xiamenensis]|uniref:hypothetical protein n=1 Tax=Shewanella xiamenensis TaxID=332186 RepID=UPI0021BEC91E|nr:hypothetical protein [Shewanella xiamenensis]MCT8866316.1 hypothetical protein [Shewanella xiamenensis]
MTITRADLKVFKPEQLGSSDDAGGQRTKLVVQSGKLNELFPAISDIDHAMSAVDIVKCYPALDTAGRELLLDGHVFISQKPTDPLVSMLIAEADTLDDADRMTDMVEILESSVRAGQLIRNRLIGLLAGQDTFPRAYLQSSYLFNGTEYWANVTLLKGQKIVISVEYPGAENAQYPRFEHFCEIQETVTGGATGNVQFKPAIPFNTPNYDITINGETGCTKMRYVSENDGIKYHGVSKLTAASSGNEILLESTITELLPKVKTLNPLSGNTITSGDDGSGIIAKTVSTPYITGQQTYIFELPDLLNNDYVNNGLQLSPKVVNSPAQWTRSIVGTTVTFTATGLDLSYYDIDTITIEYLSAAKYAVYSYGSVFAANKKITLGSTQMRVVFTNTSHGSAFLIATSDGNFVDAVNSVRLVQLNYETGVATKFLDSRGDFTITYNCLVEPQITSDNIANFALITDAPVLDTFYVQVSNVAGDTLLSASSDAAGVITGSGITGTITGTNVALNFAQNVDLKSLRYDISETVSLSPPPELYGLNPLRIKNGGIVNAFTAWNSVSIQDTALQVISSPAPAQTYNVRANARFVDITDAEGKSLWTVANTHYTWVKATGVVTLNSDFSGFTAPFILTDTIGEVALVTEVRKNSLVLASELSRQYPIGATVSSVQNLGDLQARVGPVRDMTAWSNNWDLDGEPATGNLNNVDYPIEVRNDTAINEDWVLIFTSPTAFRCVGRRIGQIALGDTLNDFAPINPLTLAPYFIIRAAAFGGGWNTGEAIRFKTYAASKPVMLLRTVQSGHSQVTTDRAVLAFRGNES